MAHYVPFAVRVGVVDQEASLFGYTSNNSVVDRYLEGLDRQYSPSRIGGRLPQFRLLEKGGKHHEVPVHHKAQDYVAEYLEKADFEPNKPLFQTFHKKQPSERPMSRMRALAQRSYTIERMIS